jgi:hypothetical protein
MYPALESQNGKSSTLGAIHMSTSLKPVLGRHLQGMHHLEAKISGLQAQYQRLLKERQQDITNLLSTVDFIHLDDHTLLGGLLFLKEKTTSQDIANKSLMEAWRDAGEKFLRRTKQKTRSHESAKNCPHPREGGKQAGDFLPPRDAQQAGGSPRISSEQSPPPKQAISPQATTQLPQKHPQSREA